jgi:hypothetical protein
MKKPVVLFFLLISFGLVSTATAALTGEMAKEFAYLSGQTEYAMTLSPTELKTLVERCKALQTQALTLHGSEKKVMGKRLNRLCGLFRFVLEARPQLEGRVPEK